MKMSIKISQINDKWTVQRFMRKRCHVVFTCVTKEEAEDYAQDLAYDLGHQE